MTKRIMGKANFAVGRLYWRNTDLRTAMKFVPVRTNHVQRVFKKLLDIGDFIGVEGHMFITQTGEKACM